MSGVEVEGRGEEERRWMRGQRKGGGDSGKINFRRKLESSTQTFSPAAPLYSFVYLHGVVAKN